MKQRLLNVLIALDQLVLTMLSAIGLDEEAGDNLFISAGQR